MAATISSSDAAELAARLDLDLDDLAICLACLSFVSIPLDQGDDREVRRATFAVTPDVWAEGLASPARLALERACAAGVLGAKAGLADVVQRGGRSTTARAIVRRLAADLAERAKGDLLVMGFEPWPPQGVRTALRAVPGLRWAQGGGTEGS